jgi:hypothetical protein
MLRDTFFGQALRACHFKSDRLLYADERPGFSLPGAFTPQEDKLASKEDDDSCGTVFGDFQPHPEPSKRPPDIPFQPIVVGWSGTCFAFRTI